MRLISSTAKKALFQLIGNFYTRYFYQFIIHLPYQHFLQLIVAVLLTTCLQAGNRGYGQTITLSVKNMPLEMVFSEIQRQSGFTFAYTRKVLEHTKNVTLQVEDVPIERVLDLCVISQSIFYTILDSLIIISANKIVENYEFSLLPFAGVDKNIEIETVRVDSAMLCLFPFLPYYSGPLDSGTVKDERINTTVSNLPEKGFFFSKTWRIVQVILTILRIRGFFLKARQFVKRKFRFRIKLIRDRKKSIKKIILEIYFK